MNYQELLDSLLATIREWIQDKIDLAEEAAGDSVAARDQAQSWRNSAGSYASAAETSANNAASAAADAVASAIEDLVDQAPETLDTLSELADALGNDPNFATTVSNQIGTKASTADVNAALATKADTSALTSGLEGKANTTHTHGVGDISATGTASSSTFLRGDGNWDTPTNTTYSALTQADAELGISTASRAITAKVLKAAIQHHSVAQHTSGSGLTLWTGDQAAYDALPSGTKNAAGFIAVIS